MNNTAMIYHLRTIDEQLQRIIESLVRNEEAQKKKEKELKKRMLAKGGNYDPIIECGYFRIVEYNGQSKHIKAGKVYKGSTFYSEYYNRTQGYINSPKAYFNEDNATWVLSNKDEYNEQKKGL